MFNKNITIKKTGKNYPPVINKNVKVEEKRAPTDKSVELLNESQEKPNENLIRSTRIKNNQLDATCSECARKNISGDADIYIPLMLNGKEEDIKRTMDEGEYIDYKDPAATVRKIYEYISDAIAAELFKECQSIRRINELQNY
jgi:hypothetical protein